MTTQEQIYAQLEDAVQESIRALSNSINSSNPAQLSCQVARNKLIDAYEQFKKTEAP